MSIAVLIHCVTKPNVGLANLCKTKVYKAKPYKAEVYWAKCN